MEHIDLLDRRGRLRRIGIALAIASAIAALVGSLIWAILDPESPRHATYGAWKFMFYFTALAGVGTFSLALWWLNRRNRRRDLEPPPAKARLRDGR